jgi:nitrate/nitrite transporter NarK
LGVEITVDNVAALYFRDSFHVTLKLAGILAGLIGMMNIFARALGGGGGDWAGGRWGLRGRTLLLGVVIFAEGLAMVLFSSRTFLGSATAAFLLFGLLVCMACGVTYAVVPFIRPRAVGSASGIVGAGGNFGAVLAAVLFRSERFLRPQHFHPGKRCGCDGLRSIVATLPRRRGPRRSSCDGCPSTDSGRLKIASHAKLIVLRFSAG